MLEIAGRYADGWWPADIWAPEDYAAKLTRLRASADRAGRDPDAIVPALILSCFIGSDDELAEILQAPLAKAFVLQVPATVMRAHGYEHPLGDGWRGFHDIDPGVLTRERVIEMLDKVDPQSLLDIVPSGTPPRLARILQEYCDAGLRVPKLLDYGGMAGLAYGARSQALVRETEDELLRLCGDA
jgi:phthiodiolone/phenolphthiodiolone dimycocerosates ketoreductase